jgi:hypothetical protein
MSSDGPLTLDDPPAVGIERPRHDHARFELERRLLCERIEELERQLCEERHQRRQVVEHYERLLAEHDAEQGGQTTEETGLLSGLF